ncbi:MAG: glycosyltransferase family 2 protein [Anaerolineae bacterium]|jgi:GT2 family glycosyltransferase
MKAVVIVLSWNGLAYLMDCLDAVLSQDYADFEVMVVDNGSSDGSADLVEGQYPEVRLIRNDRNLGFAAGNNVGLRAATGDVLVLLNQDTVVRSGWLKALVNTFEDPTVGIAGCKAVYPDGTIQHAGGFVYGARAETEHTGRSEPDDGRYGSLRDVDFVTGAALAISWAALTCVGPLDEGFYPAYYEDVDWCYTAREAGFRVVYAPAAQLTHHETPAAQRDSHEHKYALHRGRVRFVLKHWASRRLEAEFLPAERAWAASLGRTVEMMSARRAYLAAMLESRTIAAFRTRPDGIAHSADPEREALKLLWLLDDLRASCVTPETRLEKTEARRETAAMMIRSAAADGIAEQEALIPKRGEQFTALRTLQEIRERPFTSEVPLVGSLIAGLRQLWHDSAIRWSVLPLLHQQSRFNARLGDFIGLLMQMDDQLRVALHSTQQELQRTQQELHRTQQELQRTNRWNAELERDVAENIREINEVAERLVMMVGASSAERDETD